MRTARKIRTEKNLSKDFQQSHSNILGGDIGSESQDDNLVLYSLQRPSCTSVREAMRWRGR